MFLMCCVSIPTRLSSYGPTHTSATLTANMARPTRNAVGALSSPRRYATPNMPGISHTTKFR